MTVNANAGLATIRVGGRLYPARFVANCKTCCSPHRLQIEEGLVDGRPYSAIVRDLPDGHGLSERNIREHWLNDHLGVMEPAVGRFRERRAQERGVVVERGVERVADYLSLARTVLAKVHERLASGTLEPDVKDGLAAAKLLAALDPPQDVSEELEHCVEVLQVHMHEVEEIMRPDQLEEFRRRVNGYPVIRQLRAARHSESEADDEDGWDA